MLQFPSALEPLAQIMSLGSGMMMQKVSAGLRSHGFYLKVSRLKGSIVREVLWNSTGSGSAVLQQNLWKTPKHG